MTRSGCSARPIAYFALAAASSSRQHRPELVGHTTRPAIHWFRWRSTALCLSAIGFERLVNPWELRAASGELGGLRKYLVRLAAASPAVRFAGNLAIGRVEFLAIK